MSKQFSTPGPRSIHPDIARSRSLRRCGMVANALFPRLIAQADDQGRGKGDAADIANLSGLLLVRGGDLDALLEAVDELVAEGMVHLYEADGEPYWQLLGWWPWQGPSMRFTFPSRHPAPEGWTDAVYGHEGQPTTWRAALDLPPGKPGPRTGPRVGYMQPLRGTGEPLPDAADQLREGLAVPSRAVPGPAGPGQAGPGQAVARETATQPPAGNPGGPPAAASTTISSNGHEPQQGLTARWLATLDDPEAPADARAAAEQALCTRFPGPAWRELAERHVGERRGGGPDASSTSRAPRRPAALPEPARGPLGS